MHPNDSNLLNQRNRPSDLYHLLIRNHRTIRNSYALIKLFRGHVTENKETSILCILNNELI